MNFLIIKYLCQISYLIFSTGVRAWEVVFSILFTLFVVMVFQVALVLICTFLAFNISCLGSWVWVVICVLLAGLEGMAYGKYRLYRIPIAKIKVQGRYN